MPAVREQNTNWNLESFLDSLIIELDKARETLAIKAINKPLTYAVKDISLDLQLFPTYDGDNVKFITAQAGQSGASKVSIQLGSITDQQVRETSRVPVSKNDIRIESIEGIDESTKKKLKKMGVSSVNDLEKMEKKNVDIEKASSDDGNKGINYKNLANLIEKTRRAKNPPMISKVSVSKSEDGPVLSLYGKNLSVQQSFSPVAVINDELTEVISHQPNLVKIKMRKEIIKPEKNELILTLDPYAVFKMNIQNKK
jgi:hypothetical protein